MAELLIKNGPSDVATPRGFVYAVRPSGFPWGRQECLLHDGCSKLVVRVLGRWADLKYLEGGYVMDVDKYVNPILRAVIASMNWGVPQVPIEAFSKIGE